MAAHGSVFGAMLQEFEGAARILNLDPGLWQMLTHPKRQIAQLVQSIQQFGFTNPVLVDEAGVLIAGHGRLRAAKELGLAEVPSITLAGLSEAQKKAPLGAALCLAASRTLSPSPSRPRPLS